MAIMLGCFTRCITDLLVLLELLDLTPSFEGTWSLALWIMLLSSSSWLSSFGSGFLRFFFDFLTASALKMLKIQRCDTNEFIMYLCLYLNGFLKLPFDGFKIKGILHKFVMFRNSFRIKLMSIIAENKWYLLITWRTCIQCLFLNAVELLLKLILSRNLFIVTHFKPTIWWTEIMFFLCQSEAHIY